PGLVATGLPAPFQSIDWKPTPNALVNVGGWAVSRSLLEKLAANLRVTPGGVVNLPVKPHVSISRSRAIRLARRADHLTAKAQARLSSWTEISTLMQSARGIFNPIHAPGWLTTQPWQPIWSVVFWSSGSNRHAVGAAVVDARSGFVHVLPMWAS